jgi:hypothetical protein
MDQSGMESFMNNNSSMFGNLMIDDNDPLGDNSEDDLLNHGDAFDPLQNDLVTVDVTPEKKSGLFTNKKKEAEKDAL